MEAWMDSVMYHVVGTAEMSMDRFRPESLLSNLIADVLREAAVEEWQETNRSATANNVTARRLGEGVSGIQLEISKDGKLLQASIAGKPSASPHTS